MQQVDELINELPRDERLIIQRLRALILDIEPRIKEKLSYGVPYFSRHRRLFFLWPASQPGLKHDCNSPLPKVTMGFCYGNLLSDDQHILIRGTRKQVYTLQFSSPADIDELLLAEIIREAVIVDQQFFKKRTR